VIENCIAPCGRYHFFKCKGIAEVFVSSYLEPGAFEVAKWGSYSWFVIPIAIYILRVEIIYICIVPLFTIHQLRIPVSRG